MNHGDDYENVPKAGAEFHRPVVDATPIRTLRWRCFNDRNRKENGNAPRQRRFLLNDRTNAVQLDQPASPLFNEAVTPFPSKVMFTLCGKVKSATGL